MLLDYLNNPRKASDMILSMAKSLGHVSVEVIIKLFTLLRDRRDKWPGLYASGFERAGAILNSPVGGDIEQLTQLFAVIVDKLEHKVSLAYA